MIGFFSSAPSNAKVSKPIVTVLDLASLNLEDPPFEIKELPGKGLGILATRNLKAGDLVLKETPILIADDADGPEGVLKAYHRLSPQERQRYDSLYISKRHMGKPRPLAICLTNAFGFGIVDGIDECGVCEKGSRFNHSCRPNVHRYWDQEQKCMWFICTRDVKEGEELCTFYFEVTDSKDVRQARLKSTFEFDCTCEACSMSEEETLASDVRRRKLKTLEVFLSYLEDSPLELIKTVQRLCQLAEEEGLVMWRRYWAFEALTECVLHGDKENAERWIERVLGFERVEAGIWSTRYKKLEALKGRVELSVGWLKEERMILAGPD